MACHLCNGTGYIRCNCGRNGCPGYRPCPLQCFPGDTRVLTPSGYARIDSLKPGSGIMTFDSARRVLAASTVKSMHSHPHGSIRRIEFSGGAKALRVTASHTLLSESGWLRVDALKPGMRLVCAGEARPQRIEAIEALPEREPVYSVVTYGKKSFIAEGIVAHCFTQFRAARELLHAAEELVFRPKVLPQEALPTHSAF